MKMKTFFAASLAALALAACSKEADSGAPAPAAKTNFAVSLPGTLETYGVENPQVGGPITPYYDNVIVYLVDAGDNATGYVWTDAEIKARQKRFEQIVEPAVVLIIVNSGGVTMPTGPLSITELEGFINTLAVADQNKSVKTLADTDVKGNAAGDYLPIQQVVLSGDQTTFTTETSDDGHTLKKAAVEAVYFNNFNNDFGGSSVTAYTEAAWPSTYSPSWATDDYNAAVTSEDGTKVYAYQLFGGDRIPHVVYKVSGTVSAGYKLADGTGDADNPTPFTGKFITVKGFKENGLTLGSIHAHKIYKMGLTGGGIEITPDKITDQPEKNKIDLIMSVTVADWSISNLVPEF